MLYCVLVYCILLPVSNLASANVSADTPSKDKIQLAESYGKLPIAFEANEGQTDQRVKYFARGQGYTLFVTPQESVISMTTPDKKLSKDKLHSSKAVLSKGKIKSDAIRIKFVNQNKAASDVKTITGVDELPGTSNYFIGNDHKKWRTNVPTYEKVKYENIYPGVDLVVYGNQRQIEYDFVVEPHADYKSDST